MGFPSYDHFLAFCHCLPLQPASQTAIDAKVAPGPGLWCRRYHLRKLQSCLDHFAHQQLVAPCCQRLPRSIPLHVLGRVEDLNRCVLIRLARTPQLHK
jgi:hypothetical protein